MAAKELMWSDVDWYKREKKPASLIKRTGLNQGTVNLETRPELLDA